MVDDKLIILALANHSKPSYLLLNINDLHVKLTAQVTDSFIEDCNDGVSNTYVERFKWIQMDCMR